MTRHKQIPKQIYIDILNFAIIRHTFTEGNTKDKPKHTILFSTLCLNEKKYLTLYHWKHTRLGGLT